MGPEQACLTDGGPYALALHPYGTLMCSPGIEHASSPLPSNLQPKVVPGTSRVKQVCLEELQQDTTGLTVQAQHFPCSVLPPKPKLQHFLESGTRGFPEHWLKSSLCCSNVL